MTTTLPKHGEFPLNSLHLNLETWAWSTSDHVPLLHDIQLNLKRGECICIQGASGSGKSTLLQILAGLLPLQNGELTYLQGQKKFFVALVMQNPLTQILTESIQEELFFGFDPEQITESLLNLAEDMLEFFSLSDKRNVPATSLSMGQQYCLLIAAMTMRRPCFLLLDEPCAQLDKENLKRVSELISRLNSEGVGVMYSAHYHEDLAPITHQWVHIKSGSLCQGKLPQPGVNPYPLIPPTTEPLVILEDVAISLHKTALWENLRLTVHAGEIVYIYGKNGCGKSTLMRFLAGLPGYSKSTGYACVAGKTARAISPGQVMYLPQDPARILFGCTVSEEVLFTAQRLHPDKVYDIASIAEAWRLGDLASHAPRLLSYGQQHALAIAAISIHGAGVLLLDDPLAGLDAEYVQVVSECLARLAAGQGHNTDSTRPAIIITGHDDSLVFLAHRAFRCEDKRLVPHTAK